MECPRYLISFDTKTLPVEGVDVLVIGSGVAGLSCAIEASGASASESAAKSVLLVTKGKLLDSNTYAAQGGIAAAIKGHSKNAEKHFADTVATGEGLGDEAVIREVVEHGQEAIDFLIETGCHFDRDARGRLEVATEAAHSEARVLHAGGDKTGREIARGLVARARSMEQLRIYESCFVIDLITEDTRVVGALVLYRGDVRVIFANLVVLASGGCGRLYRESSNPEGATGDGHAMALRAGVKMRDLELVQFHPTILYVAGAPRVLVTEAVRGAGAYLRNDLGERFMLAVDARAELAPRDIVSRAIEREIQKRGEAAVFLDVTHLPQDEIRRRFPGFFEVCAGQGIDLSKRWVPVRPGPHYMIGGAEVDRDGLTSLAGFYAIGEAASSGLHGANRLASNSLLEGLVLGRKLGTNLRERTFKPPLHSRVHHRGTSPHLDLDFFDLRNAFQTQMMRRMGVERSAENIEKLLGRLDNWIELAAAARMSGAFEMETANMLHLGRAMARSALARQESRGVHYRTDFPERRAEFDGVHVEYLERFGAHWQL